MNTQNFLFNNSDKLPEGLYLDLMNKLKLDFETTKEQQSPTLVILNKSLPSKIQVRRAVLINTIVKESIDWLDREEILAKITSEHVRPEYISKICKEHNIPTTCENPRWIRQQEDLKKQQETNPDYWNATRVFVDAVTIRQRNTEYLVTNTTYRPLPPRPTPSPIPIQSTGPVQSTGVNFSM